jgi:hypothetical protein
MMSASSDLRTLYTADRRIVFGKRGTNRTIRVA